MQVKNQQLELDIKQAGSKLGKEDVKAIYCHPAYLTYMQSTAWDTLDWMKHELESRLPGEISITSDMRMISTLKAESEDLKSLLMKVKEDSEKAGLKLNIQKMKIITSGPITSWQIVRETMETVADFIFGGLQNHCDMTNLDSIFKNRDITLPPKVHLVKAMVLPVVMCGCESWTVKKAEHRRTDAFELWC